MAYESEHSLSTGTPNNSVATANLLTQDVKTIASLSSGTDVDYFKIVVDGPGLINIAFDSTTSSSSLLWNIALLDTAGQDYLLAPTRSAAGTAVQVNGADQTGTTLAVDGLAALPSAGDRFTIATTGADTVIYTVISATTLSSGSSTLTLDKSISTAPSDNAYLIFDPVQESVGTSSSLTALVDAAGTYYLKVAKADVASSVEYSVTASVTPTTEGAGTGDDNDSPQFAAESNNRLLANVAMTGNLSASDDVDYWLFTTATASDFSLNFAASSGNASSNEWNISVADWNGQAILDSAGTAINLNAGTSASANISDEINATAKTYVVKVQLADAATVNTGDYTLTLAGSNLDLNDTPSLTIGSVTSSSSGALVDTGAVKALPAGTTGLSGDGVALTSLFDASDADSSQTLSYKFTLTQPASGANTTGYIQVGSTQYGFGAGMEAPANITLTQAQMDSATFYPGDGTGDLNLYLQAIDSMAASDGSSTGALLQMTLRVVDAGTAVNVSTPVTTTLLEGDASSTDTLDISLGAAPADGETVTVYVEHDGEQTGAFQLSFSTSVLTFNSSNFDTTQSVIVTAREDNLKETSQVGKVSFRVVSSLGEASAFNDLAVDTLTYTLADAANHAPTGGVVLDGTLAQGETLTATNTLADSDGLGVITYQWQESTDGEAWSTIAGSTTGGTYTLTNAQVNKFVRVVAGYTDQEGNAEAVPSDASASTVSNVNDAPTVANAIADQTAVVDRVFSYTFANTTFSDIDPVASGGTLAYSAVQVSDATGTTEVSSGAALGDWLTFDAATRTFSASAVLGNPADVIWLKVTATDNATPSAAVSDVFSVTLNAASTGTPALVAAIADQSASQGNAFTFSVAGTFTDTDNTNGTTDTSSGLTYSATLADGSGLPDWLVFDPSTQSFSGTPANADVGTVSVKVLVTDAGGLTASDVFDIAVANVNDAPTGGVTISGTATQGNTLTAYNTLADVDGLSTLAYQWQSSPDGSSNWTNITGANSTTYKLAQAQVDQYVRVAVSYTDQRGTLESVTTQANLASSVTAQVANINDAPVAVADAITAVEAGGINNETTGTDPQGDVLSNDSDADTGDTLTVSAISGGTLGQARAGSYGSLTLDASGSYTYAVANDNALVQALRGSDNTLTDTFTYTVRDTAGLSSVANLVVTIQGANDAPTLANAIADTTSFYAGNAGSVTFDANVFADVDAGDTLTYSAVEAGQATLPSWLTFDSDTRTLTADGSQGATAVDITVTATDAGGLEVSDTFTITPQDPGATAPTLAPTTAIALSDTPAADTEATLLAATATESGTLVGAVGSESTSQSSDLVYGISGGTDNGTTVSLAGTYGTLTVTKASGAYAFTPNADAVNALSTNAQEDFVVTVTDTGLGTPITTSRFLSVQVAGANDTPTLSVETAPAFVDTTDTDTVTTLNAGATDRTGVLTWSDADSGATKAFGIDGGVDSGTLVTKVGSFTTLVIVKATGEYTLTPNATAINALGFDTAEDFTVTVSDGALAASTTLSVALTAANDLAINEIPSFTAVNTLTGGTEDQYKTITYTALAAAANAQDIENQAISFRVESVTSGTLTKSGVAVTAGETVVSSGESLIWRPAANANGTLDAFTVKAIDSQGGVSATAVQVSVSVAAVNDVPVATLGTGVGTEDKDVTGMLVASDVDGDSLTFAKVGEPSHGTVSVGTDGSYTYTPEANYNGADSFTFKVNDGALDSSAATVNVTVNAQNDAPVATALSVTTNEDTATSGTLQGADVDGDSLTFAKVGEPSHGTVSVGTDGSYTYTPEANYNGADSFTFKVSDGALESVATSVEISVVNVDDEAAASVEIHGTVQEGATLTAEVADLQDVDGSPVLSYDWQRSTSDSTDDADWTPTGVSTADYAIDDSQSEVGQYLRVVVTSTDALGGETVFTQAASQAVANVDDEAVGNLEVTGQVKQGGTVAVDASGLTDPDGEITSTSYQWQHKQGEEQWVPLLNANSASFVIADDQSLVGDALRVQVTTIDALGGDSTLHSDSVTVANVNDEPQGAVSISGTASAGLTLTASHSLSDVDGLGVVSYQWLLDGVAIEGETKASLTVGQDWAGQDLSVRASYTDGQGRPEQVDSAAVQVLMAGSTVNVKINSGVRPEKNMPGVSFEGHSEVSDAQGQVVFSGVVDDDAVADDRVTLQPSKAAPSRADASISLTDVLGALKVYLGKPLDPAYNTDYKYVAADFDANGRVDLSDVLGLLKYYLGKPVEAAPEWVFADAAALIDGQAASDQAGQPLSKAAAMPAPVQVDLSASEVQLDLVGVLRGDVDGSWSAG